ncbi:ankyrin repeat-containing domain protein, partial [Mycena epipterygia]
MKNRDGQTALIYAVSGNNAELIHCLLNKHHFEADAKDKSFRTALSHAVQCCCKDVVELLVERDDVDINSRDRHFRTPLSHALISAVDKDYTQYFRNRAL